MSLINVPDFNRRILAALGLDPTGPHERVIIDIRYGSFPRVIVQSGIVDEPDTDALCDALAGIPREQVAE